jgi:hypothetical protein
MVNGKSDEVNIVPDKARLEKDASQKFECVTHMFFYIGPFYKGPIYICTKIVVDCTHTLFQVIKYGR